MSKLAAAAFLGLLAGLLIGLAITGIVASVISAVLAMAAGVAALTGVTNPFLGQGEAAQQRSAGHDSAIAAFALCTIIGLGAGLWTRTHNLLSPNPAEIAAEWRAAKLSDREAAQMAVLSLTGASLSDDGKVTAGEKPGTGSSLLFSGGGEDCALADATEAPNADEARRTWRSADGIWPGLADALAGADKPMLDRVWRSLCKG